MLHNPANIQRTQSPSLTIRSANTAEVVRKPVGGSGGIDMASNMTAQDNNSPKNGIRYQFDQSPSASVRNSYVDNPAMDPQVRLEEYDWEELEEQFSKRMEAFKAVEENIWQEWRDWGEVFKAWASTISVHDEDRASKRLRTRIAYTQNSEEALEAKRQHYIKVVQAFESALALLGDG